MRLLGLTLLCAVVRTMASKQMLVKDVGIYFAHPDASAMVRLGSFQHAGVLSVHPGFSTSMFSTLFAVDRWAEAANGSMVSELRIFATGISQSQMFSALLTSLHCFPRAMVAFSASSQITSSTTAWRLYAESAFVRGLQEALGPLIAQEVGPSFTLESSMLRFQKPVPFKFLLQPPENPEWAIMIRDVDEDVPLETFTQETVGLAAHVLLLSNEVYVGRVYFARLAFKGDCMLREDDCPQIRITIPRENLGQFIYVPLFLMSRNRSVYGFKDNYHLDMLLAVDVVSLVDEKYADLLYTLNPSISEAQIAEVKFMLANLPGHNFFVLEPATKDAIGIWLQVGITGKKHRLSHGPGGCSLEQLYASGVLPKDPDDRLFFYEIAENKVVAADRPISFAMTVPFSSILKKRYLSNTFYYLLARRDSFLLPRVFRIVIRQHAAANPRSERVLELIWIFKTEGPQDTTNIFERAPVIMYKFAAMCGVYGAKVVFRSIDPYTFKEKRSMGKENELASCFGIMAPVVTPCKVVFGAQEGPYLGDQPDQARTQPLQTKADLPQPIKPEQASAPVSAEKSVWDAAVKDALDIVKEPFAEEPLVEEPLAKEEPPAEEPLVEEPLVESPVERPLVVSSLVEELNVGEPPVDESFVKPLMAAAATVYEQRGFHMAGVGAQSGSVLVVRFTLEHIRPRDACLEERATPFDLDLLAQFPKFLDLKVSPRGSRQHYELVLPPASLRFCELQHLQRQLKGLCAEIVDVRLFFRPCSNANVR